MKKPFFVLSVLMTTVFVAIQAQESANFKPYGKVMARAFLNMNSTFGEKNTGPNFDIKRACLGYQYHFSPNLSATVVSDFAAGNKNGHLTTTIRNAFLQWHKNDLTIRYGLIGLYQFNTQESYWGHRYVYKSFQDQNKFGHSIDIGLSAKYQIIPQLAMDISYTNGEGYKTIVNNKSSRYELGLSGMPMENLIVRLYADLYNDHNSTHPDEPINLKTFDNQYTYNAFVGYKNDLLKAGLEYNYQMNADLKKNNNMFGYSAFLTINLANKWNTFARFDILQSADVNGHKWYHKDGKTTIVGAEYQLFKNVKIAPNFRINHNDATKKNNYQAFINVEFRM